MRYTFEHKGKVMDSWVPRIPFLAHTLTSEGSIVNRIVEWVNIK